MWFCVFDRMDFSFRCFECFLLLVLSLKKKVIRQHTWTPTNGNQKTFKNLKTTKQKQKTKNYKNKEKRKYVPMYVLFFSIFTFFIISKVFKVTKVFKISHSENHAEVFSFLFSRKKPKTKTQN